MSSARTLQYVSRLGRLFGGKIIVFHLLFLASDLEFGAWTGNRSVGQDLALWV